MHDSFSLFPCMYIIICQKLLSSSFLSLDLSLWERSASHAKGPGSEESGPVEAGAAFSLSLLDPARQREGFINCFVVVLGSFWMEIRTFLSCLGYLKSFVNSFTLTYYFPGLALDWLTWPGIIRGFVKPDFMDLPTSQLPPYPLKCDSLSNLSLLASFRTRS